MPHSIDKCWMAGCGYNRPARQNIPLPGAKRSRYLFCFPKDNNLLIAWIKASGNPKLLKSSPSTLRFKRRICEGHFLPSDRPSSSGLWPGSVPSVFEHNAPLSDELLNRYVSKYFPNQLSLYRPTRQFFNEKWFSDPLEALKETPVPTFTGDHTYCGVLRKCWTDIPETFQDNSQTGGTDLDPLYIPRWPRCEGLETMESTLNNTPSQSNLDASTPNFYFDENLQAYTAILPDTELLQEDNIEIIEDVSSQCSSGMPDSTASVIYSDLLEKSTPGSSQMSELIPSAVNSKHSISHQSGVTQTQTLQSASSLDTSSLKPAPVPELYWRRGSEQKRDIEDMSQAEENPLNILRTLSTLPVIPQNDSSDHFGAYVALRLKRLSSSARDECEYKLMEVLNSFKQFM